MTITLESLNLTELDILLAHLRLGSGHLESQLDEEQLSSLLSLGSLSYEQLNNISSNRLEKSGNVALVLNTVITSIFGAWMGFSGFMELHLDSYSVLCGITALAILTSLTVGIFNFRLTLKNAKSAIHNQRIHNLQLNTLKLITNKEQKKQQALIKYLNNALNYLVDKSIVNLDPKNPREKLSVDFQEDADFSTWFFQLNNAVESQANVIAEDPEYKFYSTRLLKSLLNIKTLLETSYINLEPRSKSLCTTIKSGNQLTHNPFIRLLSRFRIEKTNQPLHKKWLKSNYLPLVAGIFPTMLGGFASMFVFLAGGPNLAKELGLTHIEHLLKNPTARLIEISVAISLTIYYGLSFVYNNYKNFKREFEVEKTKRFTNQLEREDVFLKMKIGVLNKIKAETTGIINIYTALDKLNEHESLEKSSS